MDQIRHPWLMLFGAIYLSSFTICLVTHTLRGYYLLLMTCYQKTGSSKTLDHMDPLSRLLFYVKFLCKEWLDFSFAPLLVFLLPPISLIRQHIRELQDWEENKEAIIATNNKRAAQREEWLLNHPTQLYYNECQGVIAVLTPQDYAEAQKQEWILCYADEYHQQNWCKRMAPAKKTFLYFKDQESCKILLTDELSQYSKRYKLIEGRKWFFRNWRMYDELIHAVKPYDVEFIHKSDIFIPYVHDLSAVNDVSKSWFDSQVLLHGYHALNEILYSQVPAEFQPLPDKEPILHIH